MKSELKSIAFAFKSRDIELYTDFNQQDCFFINRLVCSNCNSFFDTQILECFLCGETNWYVFTCKTCHMLTSITGNGTRKCNQCNTATKQFQCKNQNCLSNTTLRDMFTKIKKFEGIFKRNSGWNLSCVHCVNCGSAKHEYKGFRVFLYDKKIFDNSMYQEYKNKNCEKDDLIILKQHKNNKVNYDYEIIDNQTNKQIEFDKIGKKGLDLIMDEILNIPTTS